MLLNLMIVLSGSYGKIIENGTFGRREFSVVIALNCVSEKCVNSSATSTKVPLVMQPKYERNISIIVFILSIWS